MRVAPALQPFAANAVPADRPAVTYGYTPNIVAPGAAQEIQQMLDAYRGWSWP
ncbi:MAG TPA: hypothetical protein VE650_11455 [Acetobacteraceae bacterium]|jgi:hypothetical protein|nr:hypothetical protein [Acetobacteraceae bacterium]